MVDITREIERHREYLIHEAERVGEQLAQMGVIARILRRLEALPSFEDVAMLSLIWDYINKRPSIKVYLDKDRKDSSLVRDIVGVFGGTMKKSVNHDGIALDVTGEVEGVTLGVGSYLPATCRIVEEEYDIPVTEARKGKRRKIVCEPPETDEQAAADVAVEQVV